MGRLEVIESEGELVIYVIKLDRALAFPLLSFFIGGKRGTSRVMGTIVDLSYQRWCRVRSGIIFPSHITSHIFPFPLRLFMALPRQLAFLLRPVYCPLPSLLPLLIYLSTYPTYIICWVLYRIYLVSTYLKVSTLALSSSPLPQPAYIHTHPSHQTYIPAFCL